MNFTPMVALSRCSSDDEKTVCPVTLQLLDEPEFPLQVGTHRGWGRIRALVGTLVATLARTRCDCSRVWPRMPLFESRVDHVHVPSHLREPGSGHLRAAAEVVAEHDTRAAHGGE